MCDAISLYGVGIPCFLPRRTMTPLRASHSMGRLAARSACMEFVAPSGALA